ncbi:hypothetical protein [Saccharopolyspora taberi]|uniref:Uncharacterized protein n=1 Tax=Saccharopolyspora taberi TaxID=60895 RepID=A0ABN3VI55_9PSEU
MADDLERWRTEPGAVRKECGPALRPGGATGLIVIRHAVVRAASQSMTLHDKMRGDITMPEDMGELIEQVRHLANVKAVADPEAAKEKLNALIFTYGRAAVGAALVAVAPAEMAELATRESDPVAVIDGSIVAPQETPVTPETPGFPG